MITFTCNPLQAVRLSVIYYNIPVIDYRVSVSINLNFQKPRERDFCSNSNPKSLKLQNLIYPSILNQITSHKAQNSSFLIFFHLHRLKLPKTPPNGKTIEVVKGGCYFIRSHWNTKPRNIQGADISNSSLHIISYVVFLRRTMYPIQFSIFFLFHYRP